MDIVRRVNAGERVVRTAEVPGLTRNTVKTYLQRTLEKLGARNRVEALARAGERGILQASRTRRGSVRVPWRGRGSSPASTAARSSRGDRTGRRRPRVAACTAGTTWTSPRPPGSGPSGSGGPCDRAKCSDLG
ncbi:LuxR C-terminal-related transcriptional regulator [Streptomyces sp. NPDC002187]|uniref:LuxR C-terminal-related transcriptional regulator n=1 Tax=Streptomyces sp. NPDC002187 TaxID=3364637 RepID=UPI0036A69E63